MILIAGPCVIENLEYLDETANVLSSAVKNKDIEFYFKASAVKDNRTKVENYSGVGMKEGISMLLDIKRRYDVNITTDFHNENDIFRYGGYVDLIQIPAYLAQQTSLIEAAAKMHKPVHIKKPQFLGPEEANQPVQKLKDFGQKEKIILTDRGTMLGYDQTFVDFRHIPIMKEGGGDVLVDVTHPNKNYPRQEDYSYFYSVIMARSAVVSGADGIFFETHPDCSEALCDGKTMINLDNASEFIEDVYNLFIFTNGE